LTAKGQSQQFGLLSKSSQLEEKIMSERENVVIVHQAYNNFKTGNIQGLLDLLSDDVTWQLPEMENVPFGGERTTPAGVGEFFALVGANQEALRFEPREIVAQGDKVVSLGYYQWRLKATGREFDGEFAHVFTIRDGEIVAFHEYTDTAACANAYAKAMSA
jgi:ketosteroid isomerase-like protein